MSFRRSVLFGGLLPVLLLTGTPLLALKAPDQGAPTVEPAQPLSPRSTEPKTSPEPEDAMEKNVAPRPANGRFVPSERIKADSAVSFPVDI